MLQTCFAAWNNQGFAAEMLRFRAGKHPKDRSYGCEVGARRWRTVADPHVDLSTIQVFSNIPWEAAPSSGVNLPCFAAASDGFEAETQCRRAAWAGDVLIMVGAMREINEGGG